MQSRAPGARLDLLKTVVPEGHAESRVVPIPPTTSAINTAVEKFGDFPVS